MIILYIHCTATLITAHFLILSEDIKFLRSQWEFFNMFNYNTVILIVRLFKKKSNIEYCRAGRNVEIRDKIKFSKTSGMICIINIMTKHTNENFQTEGFTLLVLHRFGYYTCYMSFK